MTPVVIHPSGAVGTDPDVGRASISRRGSTCRSIRFDSASRAASRRCSARSAPWSIAISGRQADTFTMRASRAGRRRRSTTRNFRAVIQTALASLAGARRSTTRNHPYLSRSNLGRVSAPVRVRWRTRAICCAINIPDSSPYYLLEEMETDARASGISRSRRASDGTDQRPVCGCCGCP